MSGRKNIPVSHDYYTDSAREMMDSLHGTIYVRSVLYGHPCFLCFPCFTLPFPTCLMDSSLLI